jgi:putative hydrolase
MPFFSELGKMLSQQGPLSWDAARQVAIMSATGGEAEANVDPQLRITIEQLARVAELQVSSRTGLSTSVSGSGLKIVPVTRSQWVQTSLEAWRPLFERLAAALADDGEDEAALTDPNDPTGFMAPLMKMVGPMMLGMTAGGLLGQLARRSFGQYDTPVPRSPSDEVLVVPANISAFGDEWSLDADDLYLWVCLYEVTHHAVMGIPHVRQRLEELLHGYLDGFEADPGAFEQKLEQLDPTAMGDMSGLQDIFSDPEALLGAMRSPQQDALLPHLVALTSTIVGFVDWTMDQIGTSLIASYQQVTEAVRRRRVEADPSDRFVEQLFGLELSQSVYEAGAEFVHQIARRAGDDGVARLWADPEYLPTPNEIDAPGVWVARVGLSGDLSDSQLDELGDVEIPDDLSDL